MKKKRAITKGDFFSGMEGHRTVEYTIRLSKTKALIFSIKVPSRGASKEEVKRFFGSIMKN